jgi:hypothetical protein
MPDPSQPGLNGWMAVRRDSDVPNLRGRACVMTPVNRRRLGLARDCQESQRHRDSEKGVSLPASRFNQASARPLAALSQNRAVSRPIPRPKTVFRLGRLFEGDTTPNRCVSSHPVSNPANYGDKAIRARAAFQEECLSLSGEITKKVNQT